MRQSGSKVLILGGSSEAAALARALAPDSRFEATLSLAGVTEHPGKSPVPVRTGGFGGAQGLADYLNEHGVGVVVDATHPFAETMKRHAVEGAARAGVPLLAIRRPPWTPEPGDNWIMVDSIEAAAAALGQEPKRVMLTTGRKELAPFKAAGQHSYVLRSVEPPEPSAVPPRVEVITARGPFAYGDEVKLLRAHDIEVLVTKNSGGTATAAKLAAARALNLPVIMVSRPDVPDAQCVESVDEAVAWLAQYHGSTGSA
jgi:precorrin-6A/cobalt-precorrin-6A reductase